MKKQRRLKKGLALLLAMAMVVGAMSGMGTVKVSAATAADGYDENGFCTTYSGGTCNNGNHTECNGYQPAEVVSDTHYSELKGDFGGYYAIENAGQLYWFADKVNGGATSINGVLVVDITVNNGVLDKEGNLSSDASSFRSWTPIGNLFNGNHLKYTGTFDGRGHIVSGLYFNGSTSRCGFFGYLGAGCSVSNVGIVDSYFKSSSGWTGGVCGDNTGNASIKNCYCAGTVIGGGRVGGVCGRILGSGTITNCYYTGAVSGLYSDTKVGGVCGYCSAYGTITNCYYETMDGVSGGINSADVTGQAEGKETALFNGGEVAYQLSQGTDGSIWGQDLSTATNYPVLGGKKVYQTTPCIGYTNDANGVKNHVDSDGDGYCDSCKEQLNKIMDEKLEGYTLSLNGNIGVNFYMSLPDDIVNDEDAYMEFTLPNTNEKTKVYVTGTHEDGATATTDTIGGKTYYVFSCEVAAKEMTDVIQAQIIAGAAQGTLYTYTVKDYADYILAHTDTYGDKVVALVKAMLNYGAYSQTYFDYQTAKLANADLAEGDRVLAGLTASSLSDNKAVVTKNEAVCTFASAYLTLKSETAVNVYVKLADGVSQEDVTFEVDGNAIAKDNLIKGTGSYEGYYILSVDNIQASALDDRHTFTVTNGDQKASLSYGPMSYCYSILASETAGDNLKNVVKALYAYNTAANNYVAN